MFNSSKFKLLQSTHFLFVLLLLALTVLLLSVLQLEGLISLPFIFYGFTFLLLAVSSIFSFISRNSQPVAVERASELRDSLTHLPNLPLFIEYLEYAISMAKRHNKVLAVINLDVKKISEVNHRYGYTKGSKLISDVATRLNGLTRDCDAVARLSGSGFGLILNLIERTDEVDRAVQRVMTGMQLPFLIDNDNIVLNISYGLCVYPSDEGSVEDLNHYAELALEHARQEGGNTYRYYNKK